MDDLVEGLLNIVYGGLFAEKVQDIVQQSTTLINVMNLKSFYNIIKPVGIALLVLFFLIDLTEKATQDNFNIQQFIRSFVKLIIAYVFVNNGYNIMSGILSAVNSINNSFTYAAGGYNIADQSTVDSIKQAVEAGDGFLPLGSISAVLSLIIPAVFLMVIELLLKVLLYGRTIELAIRMIFTPLGLADMYTEGTRGSGFRYLKKFAAVGLQGGVIIAIFFALGKMSSAMLMTSEEVTLINLFATSMQACVLNVCALTLAFKAQGIANDICGV